jgi:tetratricopeptide (TPR) repeat protein
MSMTGILRAAAGAALLMVATPALADWHEVSSDHFVIYADDDARVIERFAQNLERYHSAMTFVFGRTPDKPSPSNRVVIYVVGGRDAVRELAGGQRRVGGFYIPRAGASRAFVQDITNKSGYPDFSTIILLHEYAHHFLIGSSRFAMPRWVNEGAAEFFAAASFNDDGSVLIGRAAQHRGPELFNAEPVPLRELLDAAPYRREDEGKRRDAFYGYAWLLYHYLTFSDARAGQLAQYQVGVAQGQSSLAAAEAAFGDLDKLEAELRGYRRARMMSVKLTPEKLSTGTITQRPLTAGEAAIMPVQIRSQRGVGDAEAATLVAEARRVAAKYPEDAGVLTALAEAEYDAGNDAEAIAAADAALARDPARANAYVQKGFAQFRLASKAAGDKRSAAFAEAVKTFVALNKRENDHPVPLIFFYRAQIESGAKVNENARAALERAAELAPFDHGLQVNTGIMLIGEGKIAYARTILAPVAANPHGGWAAARAKQLVAAIADAPEGTPLELGKLPEPGEAEVPGGDG